MLVTKQITAALLLAATAAYAADKPRPAPPVKPIADYLAKDTHPAEHVTVAAEPCIDPAQCAFFRNAYVQHGFLPVRVIIANDRDQPLTLDNVRIQFLPADGGKLPAATDEDINRRLFSRSSAAGTKIPLIPITIHHEPVDKKITNDDTDFGFKSLTVAPHTSAAGYVFYDTRALDDPILQGAELYLKMIYTAAADKGGPLELFAFTIPLTKWYESQPKPAPRNQPAQK